MPFMTDSQRLDKKAISAELSAQVRKFLRSGGKITKIPLGVMKHCETQRKSGDFSINGVDRKKRFNQAKEGEAGKAIV